MLKQGDS